MPSFPHLLVYESKPVLAPLLSEQIAGWRVIAVATADRIIDHLPANAVLLSGEGDHAAIAAELRQAHMIGPIFSLSGDQKFPAPLISLERPFRLNSLLSRLQSPETTAIDGAIIGEWRLDASQRYLVANNASTVERLTDKEFEVLSLLLTTAPEAVSREDLQNKIWQYNSDVTTHTVETHIWRLRQKLEADPGQPSLLITTADGYRLAEAVSALRSAVPGIDC